MRLPGADRSTTSVDVRRGGCCGTTSAKVCRRAERRSWPHGNRFPDECDISGGFSQDVNGNGVPNLCECPRADIYGDGSVGLSGLAIVLSGFGATQPGLQGDVNDDGDIDITDLSTLLSEFGTACPV